MAHPRTRRVRLAPARLAGAAAWGVLALWLAGRLLSDRWEWSQWLLWIPTPVAIAGACAVLVFAAVLNARCWGRRRRKRDRRVIWRHPLVPVAACAAWMIAVEWRAAGWLDGHPRPAAVRVLCWNATSADGRGFAAAMLAEAPNVVVLVNRPSAVEWGAVLSSLGQTRGAATHGPVTVAAAFSVLRSGGAGLGLRGRLPHPDRAEPGAPRYAIDQGWAMFFELDTRAALGRSLVVWVIDLPSDPFLARWRATGDAASAIASWRAADGSSFPAPDLVIGDFNLPRGSVAARRIVGDMTDAHAQAGAGPAYTYPRAAPLWRIDRTFVGAALRAARYRTVDPGTGTHRLQVVDLSPR